MVVLWLAVGSIGVATTQHIIVAWLFPVSGGYTNNILKVVLLLAVSSID